MSVFKRSGSSEYSYDFIVGGARYSGNTRAHTKREAEQEERRLKADVREELGRRTSTSDWTFEKAALTWLDQVGKHHVNALTDLTDVERLIERIGAKTMVSEIDNRLVARVVAARRDDVRKVGNGRTPQDRVSNATVNRSTTELLRKILRRAAKVWKLTVQDVHWTEHILKEPKERVREASVSEEHRLLDELSTGYDVAVNFAIMTGCRLDEIVGLTWHQVQMTERQFSVVGKFGAVRTIPMSQAIYDLLLDQQGNHPSKVFTYIARRTDKRKGLVSGKRYGLTYSGLQTAARRAVKKADIVNFRFHDTRHTAATRTLRVSNLRVVQHLLGHADITTTAKYAHAQSEDIRAALDAASPTPTPTVRDTGNVKPLRKRA